MKHQTGSTRVLTATWVIATTIIILALFYDVARADSNYGNTDSPTNEVREGNVTVYNTETIFDTCRGRSSSEGLVCTAYIVGVWDSIVVSEGICVDPVRNNLAGLQSVIEWTLGMIRNSSGYASSPPNARTLFMDMWMSQGAIYPCPKGNSL